MTLFFTFYKTFRPIFLFMLFSSLFLLENERASVWILSCSSSQVLTCLPTFFDPASKADTLSFSLSKVLYILIHSFIHFSSKRGLESFFNSLNFREKRKFEHFPTSSVEIEWSFFGIKDWRGDSFFEKKLARCLSWLLFISARYTWALIVLHTYVKLNEQRKHEFKSITYKSNYKRRREMR